MGRVLTNNTSLQYAIETAIGSLAQAVAAQGTLTFTGQPADAETVVIGGQTYTWETAAIDVADEVAVGADVAESISNLVSAINTGASGSGTIWGAGTTQNSDVTARKGPGDTLIVTARTPGTAANSVGTTETMANASWGAATLEGGLNDGDAGAFNSEWKSLEPNDIADLGADITTVARDPISNSRQRRKGTVTDLDSQAGFDADLTLDVFEDFAENFTFALAVNRDTVFRGAHVANGAYQVTELTAAQAAKFIATGGVITLVNGRNYVQPANNGLAPLTADPGLNDAELEVAGLTTEDAPTNAVVELAGVRTDDVTWDWDAPTKTAAMTSAADITDWSTLGFSPGQVVHIGSPDGSGGVTNGFTNAVLDDMFGYARIRAINGATMTMDKVDAALQFDDLTAETTDIMYGRFFRNVPVSDPDFIERSVQIEAAWVNLQDPGPGDEYEYAVGNFANQLTFNIPLTNKATVSVGLIGTDTPTPVTTRKLGADSARQPSGTGAFNTSADIARLRITEADEDGLTTDFKNLTITLSNNVNPEKVLGTLGAKFMNAGNFDVDIEAQLLFTNSGVTRAIRNNETLTMDFVLKNDDTAIAVDIPSHTLGGGAKTLPVDESVLIDTTVQAFQDSTLGTSIGMSLIPVVP